MADSFKPGDSVSWQAPGARGRVNGEVTKKLTHDTAIKGHTVRADNDHPQLEVKSEKTGAKAAHKPDALKKSS